MATELAILADPANRGECDEAMPRPFVDLDSPHTGEERSSYFTPDGKHIAFTASYDGNWGACRGHGVRPSFKLT